MVASPFAPSMDGLGHSELRHIAAWIAYGWVLSFLPFAFCCFFVFRILFGAEGLR